MDPITALTRPADGPPQGALVLLHGRGSSEHDLVDLFDLVDPGRRLVGITPRAPLALPPGGRHWYALREIGYPDPATFLATMQVAGEWLDGLAESTGVPLERTVLGGFSQGCVMALAVGLGAELRRRPVAVCGFSGFVPTVDGWSIDASRPLPPVALGHGAVDPVIPVELGRQARDRIVAAGGDVRYREYPLPHTLDPEFVEDVRDWIATLGPSGQPAA